MADSISFVPLLIDGKYRPSSTNETFPVFNSYTNTVVSTASSVSSDDCRAAIEAAHRAFPAWEATPPHVRREVLLRGAQIMDSDEWKQKMIDAMTRETSSTQAWTAFNSGMAAIFTRSVASMVNELKGDTFPSSTPGGQVFVQRRAHGVVYSVGPWNAPANLTIRAAATPIICGNTVVLRPSEYSPLTQALIVNALQEGGLPAGVLNFIPMSAEASPTLTSEIIAHPYVRKITFTGSDRVGKIIALEAAKHLKPCILELGGKAPSIILADADIDQASRSVVIGGFMHSGQICVSTERLIVQRPALEPLLAALKQHTATLDLGGPETAKISSVFSAKHAEHTIGLIREAEIEGAEIVIGDGARKGALVQPHVLLGVKPGMRLWEKESFGPVVAMSVVDTIDEAVELANASEYSLAAAVWTKDVYNAINVAMRLRAGMANINGATTNIELFQGLAGLGGASGYGRFDVDHFTDKRIVTLHPPERKYPFWNM